MRVAISGATGFIGSEIVRELLLAQNVSKIILLIRPHSDATAHARWDRVVEHWRKFAPEIPTDLTPIEVVSCDLEKPGAALVRLPEVDYFIHSAASTDFHLPLTTARAANVYTSQRALSIAREIVGLKAFIFMSTAFVSGTATGLIKEDAISQAFSNTYEKSKMEAEGCVKASGLPWVILRPSIVVGHSVNGYVWRMKVIYSVIRVWIRGFVKRAPMDQLARADIVPVDFVSKSTIALLGSGELIGQVLHLCSGRDAPRSLEILKSAARVFGIQNPLTAPLWYARLLSRLPSPRILIGERLASVLEAMRWHLPYLGTRGREFDTLRAEKILRPMGIKQPKFCDYGDTIFSYCQKTQWGRRPLNSRFVDGIDSVDNVRSSRIHVEESEGQVVYN